VTKEFYDTISIVFIHSEGCFGSTEKIGAFASLVKYQKDGIEYEEIIENEDFSIVDEIALQHIEEENNG